MHGGIDGPRSARRGIDAGAAVFVAALFAAAPSFSAPDLIVGSAAGQPGDTVVVPITFTAGGGVEHGQWEIAYDHTVLGIEAVSPGGAPGMHLLDWAVVAPGRLRVLVYSPSCEPLAGGEIASLSVAIDAAASPGVVPLVLEAVTLSDAGGSAVALDGNVDGEIEIVGGGGIEPPAIPSASGAALAALALALAALALRRLRPGAPCSLLVLALLPAALGLFAVEAAAAQLPPGDADGDGDVDAVDAAAIVSHILGRSSAPGDADCNGDSLVDVRDIACVLGGCASQTNSAPVLAPIADREVREGEVVSFAGEASDPDPGDVLTFSLLDEPAGMTVDRFLGTVLWVPGGHQVGEATVRLRVTDAGGLFAERTFRVVVRELGGPPELLPIADQSSVEGIPLFVTATASDPDLPDDVLGFSLVVAPAGMTIDPAGGTIAWTPADSDVGLHDVTVRVEDREGLLDFTSFSVAVAAVNEAPVAAGDVYVARPGETLAVAAPGVIENDSDPNGDPLVAELVEPPSDGVLDFHEDGSFEYTPGPAAPVFAPTVAYTYDHVLPGDDPGAFNVRSQPSIGDLDGDGVPEIVAHVQQGAGFGNLGRIVAIRGDTGETVWTVHHAPRTQYWPADEAPPALGDLDGDGTVEVVFHGGCTGSVVVFHHDGSPRFTNQPPDEEDCESEVGAGAGLAPPVLADLDGDGGAEILITLTHPSSFASVRAFRADGTFFDSEPFPLAPRHEVMTVADVDLDGRPDVVVGDHLLDASLELVWGPPGNRDDNGFTAVGNLDDDPYGEIVVTDSGGRLRVLEHDGTLAWELSFSPSELCDDQCRNPGIPGPATLADFDDDGEGEIGFGSTVGSSGAGFYQVFERDGTFVWQRELCIGSDVQPCPTSPVNTRGTFFGAGVFDLDSDGVPEVTALTGRGLVVLRGDTGAKRWEHAADAGGPFWTSSSIQFFEAIPLVADVDGDGRAEILVPSANRTGFDEGGDLYVYENAADDWARTRPLWNQFAYHVTNVGLDLAIPARERPHWLVPGLDADRMNAFLPDEVEGADRFTYRVNDGEHDSNTATVHLPLRRPNDPPRILSAPRTVVGVGFPYRYSVLASDPDAGDVLSYELTEAPAGMTMDDAGVVRWQPSAADLGPHTVSIAVGDSEGAGDLQVFVLAVVDPQPVPDVVGLPLAAAESAITGAGFVVGGVRSSDHPTIPAGAVVAQSPAGGGHEAPGAAVDLVVSLGPGPADADDDADGFTENEGDCDDANGAVFPGATDAGGDGVDRDCDGIDGNQPIQTIVVEPGELTLLEGESAQLIAFAIFGDGTAQNVTAVVTWSAMGASATVSPSGLVTAGAGGSATITATRDAVTGSATVAVVAADGGDTAGPAAEITSPADGEQVFGPLDVVGTANDPNLVRYELAISPADEESFTLLHAGTGPVLGGVLGTLDPTLRPNDLYTLRLRVLDAGGNETVDEVTVQLDGEQKVGHFTLSFRDLSIPISGIPITVTRTYDSRDQGRGEFGVGWRLGVQTLQLSCTEPLGEGWFAAKSGLSYSLLSMREHRCAISLPDGRAELFDFVPTPSSSAIVPFTAVSGSFRARPGTLGTLRSLDNPFLLIVDAQPGEVQLLDDTTLDVFAPGRFLYTGADGSRITFSDGAVEAFEDRNGNRVTFEPGGIVHSAGASVLFDRDGLGRITSLLDPAGNVQRYAYNAAGDLVSHTDAEGNVTRFFYDRAHHLLRIEDPLGHPAVRNEFDDDGRLISSTDAAGNAVTYAYDLLARTRTETDPRGNAETVEYDERGQISARRRTLTIDGSAVVGEERFEHDADGNETAYVDGDGRRTERSFDARGNLLATLRDPGGLAVPTLAGYDAAGDLVSETDPLGNVTTYAYDARRNPREVTAPEGVRTRYLWDAAGRLSAIEDENGGRTLFAYDPLGRLVTREERDGSGSVLERTELAYDANGNLLTQAVIDPGGATPPLVTRFAYDRNSRLVGVTDAGGASSTREYDAAGRLAAEVDAVGQRTEYTWDARGLLNEIRFPDGTSVRHEYDTNGNRTKTVDQRGIETRFEYDEANRRVRTIRAGVILEEVVLSPAGKLIASIDARGHRTDYEYDALGRRVRTRLPAVLDGATGVVTRPEILEEYDAEGNRTALIDPLGHRTEYEYDGRGRVVRITRADGSVVEREYDDRDRVRRVVDPDGEETLYELDAAGRLLAVTLPAPAPGAPTPVTRYAYDAAGNLVSRTDALGRTTGLRYDAVGRLVARVLPDGATESHVYDAAGRLVGVTDFGGRALTMQYDALGRLLSRAGSGVLESATYTPTGRRATVADARGTTSFAYDDLDRLVGVQEPEASLTYEYDAAGNLVSLVANGRTVSYEYDALDRLVRVVSSEGVTEYRYDLAGNRLLTVLPNGVTSTAAYDEIGRITRLEHRDPGGELLRSFDYTHTSGGRRSRVIEDDGSVETYVYDALGRLISETRTGTAPRSVTYEYDAVGNRTRRVADGVVTDYVYDENDRLIAETGVAYTYDANGNRLTRAAGGVTETATWDALDRLVDVSSASGATSYAYDIDRRLVRRQGPAGELRFLVASRNPTGLDQIVEERDGGGVVAAHTYGTDRLETIRGGASRFFLSDALGSTALLTDGGGVVTDGYRYGGYGELLGTTGSSINPYLFRGERFDPDAQAYYLRARYYDPRSGGFPSRDLAFGDPIVPASLHPYLYANADPINLEDPLGLFSLPEISLAQTLQGSLRTIEIGVKATRLCRAVGAVKAVSLLSAAASFAVGALPEFETGQAKQKALFALELSHDPKKELELELEYDFGSQAVTGKLGATDEEKVGEGKLFVEFAYEGGRFSTTLGGEVEEERDLLVIRACGAFEIAKVTAAISLGGASGISAGAKEGFGFAGKAELKGALKFGFGTILQSRAGDVHAPGREISLFRFEGSAGGVTGHVLGTPLHELLHIGAR